MKVCTLLAGVVLAMAADATPVKLSRSRVSRVNGERRIVHDFKVVEQDTATQTNATATATQPGSSQPSRLLWHQHEPYAIYGHVAISSKGYVAASTFLTSPEMVEVYSIKGEALSRKTAITDNHHRDQVDNVAMSRDSTICVGMVYFQDNSSTAIYMWDLAKPTAKPEWHHMEPYMIAGGVKVSADGTLIAVQYAGYDHYAVIINFLSNTGELLCQYKGEEGQKQLVFGMSSDGHYVAYISRHGFGQQNLTVIEYIKGEKRIGQRFSLPIKYYSQHLAVSPSGEYIVLEGDVDGTLTLDVYHKSPGSILEYVRHVLPAPERSFMMNLAFSPEGHHLATTWSSYALNQNKLFVYELPTKKAIYTYIYPVNTGSKVQDEPVAVAISSNGEYVVIGSWGTLNHSKGSEQIHVFKVGVSEPILAEFTPGSMFSVDIMESEWSGVYVVACGKATHANILGNGGDVYVYEINVTEEPQEKPKEKARNMEALVNDPDLIDYINSQNVSWKAGPQKQFNGMKLSDTQGLFGAHLMNMKSVAQLPSDPERAKALPESFDSRKQWEDCVHPIRNQGACGSCWAVSATQVLGDRLCIASNHKINVCLSPEYVVECAKANMGCSGGNLVPTWDFLETQGIPTDSCYPYTAITGSVGPCQEHCTTKIDPSRANFTRYKAKRNSSHRFQTVEEMQESIMKYGPIQATFTVYQDFMVYKSGVYKHTKGIRVASHAIRIVGWGVQATTKTKYWIVANSWGTEWGELGGYFYIERGTDESHIENMAYAGLADV